MHLSCGGFVCDQVNQKMGFTTYFSLCLLGILISSSFQRAEADTCAREWLQNQGNCYAYFDNKLSWQEAETRRWRWADESTYNYKAWMTHQPDNFRNSEHCVELRRSTGFKEWNDAQCKKLNTYICKHEL
ncbi:C-type lectin lectoxin-Enh2-like isoform X3 [Rhineura floridana]|uniref:C-type lectin lectoxin-Enh2-like isoform X3 n=1 Tax=Rhineura floridana TaxID=261503 RepID=UPI002AC82F8E|nr:C-type lectin lectoxin-Enh2-like isoform X3 [Rhineura floridana]